MTRLTQRDRPTQEEFVLALLRGAGREGLCSFEVYRHGPHAFNSRNRVSELGKQGYGIRHEPCKHGTTAHVRWTLEREPEPEQMS